MIEKVYAVPHPPIIVAEPEKLGPTVASFNAIAEEIKNIAPDTIVVLSPHATLYMDYFHISPGGSAIGDLMRFGIEGAEVEAVYDEEFVSALEEEAFSSDIPAGVLGETDPAIDHGTLIPLYFINRRYNDYKLVRIGLSGMGDEIQYRFGGCIARTATETGKKIVLIASGDLSHKLKQDGPYGFAPEGPEFDKKICEIFETGNLIELFQIDKDMSGRAAECGLGAFKIMAGALDGKTIKSDLLSYEGPFGVGYGVAKIDITGESEDRRLEDRIKEGELSNINEVRKNEDDYVRLARESVEFFVDNHKRMPAPEEGVDRVMIDNAAGVFVSIKKNGNLRGCIGTTEPNQTNIATEIIHNAVSAASQDPRFDPVGKDELPYLTYSVDIIMKPEPIEDISELDPKKYGVTVSSGFKYALLLPDLEGIDTVDEQVDAVTRKAGINKPKEIEKAVFEKFEVIRHK